MRSGLGLVFAACALATFLGAYGYSIRPGAGWLDGRWLFLVALPYNWTALEIAGESHFSPDAPLQLAAALFYDTLLAYLAGAVLQALLRGAFRLVRPSRRA